ncbi:sulfatase family protein [Flagellimonas flava]
MAIEELKKPNIVIFYVDDLGYADLSSYGALGVKTPNVDNLLVNGLKFTDAHSPAATCTPSRYSLLTGEYAFRNKAKVLSGDAPLLIDTAKATLPKMLKRAGYTNAVVGKWHLGLGAGNLDWNINVIPGPLEIGFDYSFLLPATGDRVPTVYLENHKVLNLDRSDPIWVSYKAPTKKTKALNASDSIRYSSDSDHSQTVINGVGRIGLMKGGKTAIWKDEDFPDVFTDKAISFIKKNQENPFFLFFSFHDIHVPRLPNERFQGTSKMGPRGDAIVQMDWMTGRIMEELKRLGLEKNTLVIFTSDNGPVLNDGYDDFAAKMLGEHVPAGEYRGGKYSAFEGGTRVPTIVYWPGFVKPGESDALISQVDFYDSLRGLLDVAIKEGSALDSKNLIKALLGRSKTGRKYLLEESFTLSLRTKDWKYIQPISSVKEFPKWLCSKDIESGLDTIPQLYNMIIDPSEQVNVAMQNEEVVRELQYELERIVNRNKIE